MDGVGLYDLMPLDAAMTFEDVSDLFDKVFWPARYTLSTVIPPKAE
jgi:hypothetical protein